MFRISFYQELVGNIEENSLFVFVCTCIGPTCAT